MPTVLRLGAWRFHFYSNERDEPPHIHVATPEGDCKFWLDPIALAHNRGVSPVELRKIERIVYDRQVFFQEKFHEFHGR
ncbi:MAG: DUF4160 domain-containing protein [Betaproteobacteria bacterium]|nr:MAG: DUF4160 domain-containing protein [Betaproteobacteria bacterium]